MISIGNIKVGQDKLLLLAGPCQLESFDHALMIAQHLVKITADLPIDLIFKSSFDKANRTSLQGERGLGIEQGLQILADIKSELKIPVVTDIHTPEQAAQAAQVVDLLQTPAFLCRQTDLLTAVGKTGVPVNVKKGQFLAPEDMKHVAEKISAQGNSNIMLCERGTCFGYRDLVVDMRAIQTMKEIGYPVIFDATHSVASMGASIGGSSGSSGGSPKFIQTLAKAAIAAGASGLFIECHQEPSSAPSDGASMLELDKMQELLEDICKIWGAING